MTGDGAVGTAARAALARAALARASLLHALQAQVLVRCLLGCLVLLVVLWARPARADGPMCDRTGASVNVPPEVPPARSGRVEELPCDTQDLLSLLDAVEQPRRAAFPELGSHFLAACVVDYPLWWQPPLAAFAQPFGESAGPLTGYPRPLYRPPLAA